MQVRCWLRDFNKFVLSVPQRHNWFCLGVGNLLSFHRAICGELGRFATQEFASLFRASAQPLPLLDRAICVVLWVTSDAGTSMDLRDEFMLSFFRSTAGFHFR